MITIQPDLRGLRARGVDVELWAARPRLHAPRGSLNPEEITVLRGDADPLIASLVDEAVAGPAVTLNETQLLGTFPAVCDSKVRAEIADAVVVDVETTMDKKAKHSLKHQSVGAYVHDARTQLLSVSAVDGGSDVRVYDLALPGSFEAAEAWLSELARAGKRLVSHNVTFDTLILRRFLNVEFERVFDTCGYLRFRQVGASLANGAVRLGLEKLAAQDFARSVYDDPTLTAKARLYNAVDVALCRRLYIMSLEDPDHTDFEAQANGLTSRVGIEGVRIHRGRALELAGRMQRRADACGQQLSADFGFDPADVNRTAFVKTVIEEQFGVAVKSIAKKSVEFAAAKDADPRLKQFAELRSDVAQLQGGAAQLRGLDDEPGDAEQVRLHAHERYYGGHTGRLAAGAGEGQHSTGWNNQALPKGSTRHKVFGEIRTLLVAPPGKAFIAADLKTIEPRVLAYLAGDTDTVARFRRFEDLYKTMVRWMLPGLADVPAELRKLGKVAVLGLGFGMGRTKFHKEVVLARISVGNELVDKAYDTYQDRFAPNVRLRGRYEAAFIHAWRRGRTTRVGSVVFMPIPESDRAQGEGRGVRMILPTGRPLFYRNITVRTEQRYGRPRSEFFFTEGFDSTGDKPKGKSRKVWGGVLVENATQAVARDIMMGQALELEERGLRIHMTVHDEIVVVADPCGCGGPTSEHRAQCPWANARQTVVEVMSRVPASLPMLADIPVAVEINDKVYDCYGA